MPKFKSQILWQDKNKKYGYLFREVISKYPPEYKYNKSRETTRRLKQQEAH